MRVFIDADGCPVTESAINFAKQHNIECYVVCDTSHEFSFNYANIITVSKGKDSADYKIVNLISPGDIVDNCRIMVLLLCALQRMQGL